MKIQTAMAASALVLAMPAYAQSADGGPYVGVTAGTLGIGPEIGFRTSNFGARGSATFFNLSRGIDSDGVDYDGELRLRSFGGTVDLYPFGGGFRVSGGARINKNRVDLEATPTANVEIGDQTFTPAQIGVLTGRVEAKKFAPMLTIGYGGSPTRGVKFGIDAGALFQGSPRVTDLRATGSFANNPTFVAELERERREVEDDIDRFKVYPVLQLSLGYLFGGSREAAYIAPAVAPPPPPAAPATQTCPDGSVILAADYCAAPPPPPSGERG
jgi:hypothetical protein